MSLPIVLSVGALHSVFSLGMVVACMMYAIWTPHWEDVKGRGMHKFANQKARQEGTESKIFADFI